MNTRQVIMKATWNTRQGRFATMQDMLDALGGRSRHVHAAHHRRRQGPPVARRRSVGHQRASDLNPNIDIPVNETSASGKYIGKKHAWIQRGSDGVLKLHDGNRDTGAPSKNGAKLTTTGSAGCSLDWIPTRKKVHGNSSRLFTHTTQRKGRARKSTPSRPLQDHRVLASAKQRNHSPSLI